MTNHLWFVRPVEQRGVSLCAEVRHPHAGAGVVVLTLAGAAEGKERLRGQYIVLCGIPKTEPNFGFYQEPKTEPNSY